jgi:hypothetical protein
MRKQNRSWMVGALRADSKFEKDLAEGVLKDCKFHGEKIPWTKPATEHKYEPDFTHGNYVIEAKGRFVDSSVAKKYILVRDSMEERGDTREIVFLFYNANTYMPGAKKRKDGTKRKQTEWADTNNFRWFTKQTIGEILCEDTSGSNVTTVISQKKE